MTLVHFIYISVHISELITTSKRPIISSASQSCEAQTVRQKREQQFMSDNNYKLLRVLITK